MAAKGMNLEVTLAEDLFGDKEPGCEPDLFGLEVELEGKFIKTAQPDIARYWSIHEDGSLRVQPGKLHAQACEYVFKKPLSLASTIVALENLFNYLTKTPEVEVFDSYRTSIHVHVNCLRESIKTIVNFITLAIIFDELFVSQNGDTRIGNNFCLRARDAEGQIENLISSINKFGSLYQINANDRYSSVNLGSLMKFGSIEFRSLECTTDLWRVIHWVRTLQALKESARSYANPKEIVAKFSRHGPLGFMLANLGPRYEKYAKIPNAYQMLQNGMRLAQDFAYCSDWKHVKPEEKQPRGRGKRQTLDEMMQEHLNQLAQIAAQNPVVAAPQPGPDWPIPAWAQAVAGAGNLQANPGGWDVIPPPPPPQFFEDEQNDDDDDDDYEDEEDLDDDEE
jgi:hypothetical protein